MAYVNEFLPRDERRRLEQVVKKIDVPVCRCKVEHTCRCGNYPDCDCPPLPPPPCPHVLAARHGMTLEEWIRLCRLSNPEVPPTGKVHPSLDGYGEPPEPPPEPAPIVSRERLVDLYEWRAAQGLGLWRDDDQLPADREDDVSIVAGPGLVQRGLRADRRAC